ncbi:glutathione S-transferase T3-like [Eutrema salsugineum]|uniref:glutathione S-transferase T3-like n=1 Tax=Eutrema salsugineum TaxID=72664 RepID=UPI000CED39A5|nr:glutathione S-transferase T3-like [Eutrema salsugineum]
MDSMNPNGSSQGFVNLLTSQEEHTLYFSQSVDPGSSQVPIFSTQLFSHLIPAAEERKERRKWSPVKDVVLISAWLNTSKDPIISNEQKVGAFWKRITESFNNSKKMANEPDREAGQLKHRWQRINDHVYKFVACYKTALKQQSSGQNENDVMKAAHHIFYNDHMFKFNLEHAWRELRHDQKWCSVSAAKEGGKPKRRKVDASTAHSESSQTESLDVEEVFEGSNKEKRPLGVKAAKAAKKKGVGSSSNKEEEVDMKKLQTMWDLKDRDLAMKDKITNKKLLNTLLLKAEPLTEIEEALKTKFINELLM